MIKSMLLFQCSRNVVQQYRLLSWFPKSQKYPMNYSLTLKKVFRTANCAFLKYNVNPTVHYSSDVKEPEWIPVYRFPYIVHAVIMNRLKLYQTVLTISAVPPALVMCLNGNITWNEFSYFGAIAMLACSMLYIMTSFFRRLVGIIYVSKDRNLVKISHLTFWGKRNDIVLPLVEIIPLVNNESNLNNIYLKILRYNTNEVLYFSLRYGRILDKEGFEDIFGNLGLVSKNGKS